MELKSYDFYYYLTAQGNASNIEVRLRGGLFTHEGRLEVYYSGIWGTVCNNLWDKKDADVVCRMLGFSRANKLTTSAIFAVGNRPIMLARVECRGDEPSLSSCAYDGWIISYCNRKQDVGVICDTGGESKMTFTCKYIV